MRRTRWAGLIWRRLAAGVNLRDWALPLRIFGSRRHVSVSVGPVWFNIYRRPQGR